MPLLLTTVHFHSKYAATVTVVGTQHIFFIYDKRISTLKTDCLHSGTSVEYHDLFDITGVTTTRIRKKAGIKTTFFFEFIPKNFKIILSFTFKARGRYTLRAGRFGIWNPWRSRNLYLLQIVQTGSGTQPACYSIGIGVLSLGLKRPKREVTTHVNLVTLYSYSHEADRESFTFYIT
jgi:hypothetical protein